MSSTDIPQIASFLLPNAQPSLMSLYLPDWDKVDVEPEKPGSLLGLSSSWSCLLGQSPASPTGTRADSLNEAATLRPSTVSAPEPPVPVLPKLPLPTLVQPSPAPVYQIVNILQPPVYAAIPVGNGGTVQQIPPYIQPQLAVSPCLMQPNAPLGYSPYVMVPIQQPPLHPVIAIPPHMQHPYFIRTQQAFPSFPPPAIPQHPVPKTMQVLKNTHPSPAEQEKELRLLEAVTAFLQTTNANGTCNFSQVQCRLRETSLEIVREGLQRYESSWQWWVAETPALQLLQYSSTDIKRLGLTGWADETELRIRLMDSIDYEAADSQMAQRHKSSVAAAQKICQDIVLSKGPVDIVSLRDAVVKEHPYLEGISKSALKRIILSISDSPLWITGNVVKPRRI